MRTFLALRNEPGEPLPPEVPGPDMRFPETLVRHFLTAFTAEGESVFDPFAGLGTTLVVAESMGRVPLGIEADEGRCRYAHSRLQDPEALRLGDARRLAEYDLPPFDFCFTSPPYMNRDETTSPLSAYAVPGEDYGCYLADLRGIYGQIAARMTPGARAVIEVSNLKRDGVVTTLAWDIAREVAEVLHFEGETVILWEPTYGYGYDHSYCLIFRKSPR